jgi:predicted Zn finger-like uncharacterized protein
MALATRCPNCHALFRVVADQLKLRGGLVRCGACQQVFDAIGTLSYIDDAVLSTSGQLPQTSHITPVEAPHRTTASSVAAAFASQPIDGDLGGPRPAIPPPATAATEGEATLPSALTAEEIVDHAEALPETTSFDAAAGGELPAQADTDETTAQLEEAEDAQVSVRTAPAGVEQQVPPAFLRETSSARGRGFSILFGGGALLLAVLALAQLAVMFRAEILARLPEARPALTQLCKAFRCTVTWPARGELLAVVGSELQALPGTSAFELTAVVRNRGAFTLALPAIELTLTDTLNRAVARKVFAPIDYLAGESDPQARLVAGLEAGADLTIRIAFEARGLNAAGFVVYPFYL